MSESGALGLTTVLIYIPCHSDYEMAISSARRILDQTNEINNESFEIRVHIAINGVPSSPSVDGLPNTTVSLTKSILGGDLNISNGFLKALEVCPDYFWLLSANENLVENAILNLQNLISANPETDLFIANAENRKGLLELSNIFTGVPANTALGLISGVIYKYSTTKESFRQAPLFSWTGWGQLAFIQNILSSKPHSKIMDFPDHELYEKPYTYQDSSLDYSESEIVGNVYAHSFFGLPILAFSLLQRNKKDLRNFQKQWLKSNWFKINMFLADATIGDELKLQRNKWVYALAKRTFNFVSLQGIVFRIARWLPVGKLKRNRIAIRLLNSYKRAIR
jgi:hypothetical protein